MARHSHDCPDWDMDFLAHAGFLWRGIQVERFQNTSNRRMLVRIPYVRNGTKVCDLPAPSELDYLEPQTTVKIGRHLVCFCREASGLLREESHFLPFLFSDTFDASARKVSR